MKKPAMHKGDRNDNEKQTPATQQEETKNEIGKVRTPSKEDDRDTI